MQQCQQSFALEAVKVHRVDASLLYRGEPREGVVLEINAQVDHECLRRKQNFYNEVAKRKAAEKADRKRRLARADDSPDLYIRDFLSKLKNLSQLKLRTLCEENNLLKSGTKTELQCLLFECYMHGHTGPCPDCKRSRVKLIFANPHSLKPTDVQCTSVPLKKRNNCKFGKRPLVGNGMMFVLQQKLKDDEAGTLRSVGIDVGAPAGARNCGDA
jgi:hypothetical protein